MTTFLAIVFVLFILIFFHELGHFLAAKSVGVRIERFYIGFNPFGLGIKKKIGDTEYGLGVLPLGGYVKMSGVIDESMDTNIAGEPWEFQSKNPLQKIWVLSGGVVFNLILAVILFAGLTFSGGISEADPASSVGFVTEDYPAEAAGIQAGDRITAIDGAPVDSWEALTGMIHTRPGEEITVVWEHEGVSRSAVITTREEEIPVDGEIKTVGLIGIGPVINTREAGLGEAVITGFSTTGYWFQLTYKSLAMIVTGKASMKDVGGPIFIAQLAGRSARSGFASLLGLLAIISVNLALINILPIPALDGGQVVVVLIEAVIRRPLSIKARMAIQQFGMMLLLTLMAVIIFNDVARIFQ